MSRITLRAARLLLLPPLCAVLAAPGVAAAAFTDAPLTDTSQVTAPGGGFPDLLAAVNFRYTPTQPDAAGPVNGITFQNVDPRSAAPTPLAGGGSVIVTGAGSESDRSRSQNTAATITGPDDANLESIANTIGFVGFTEISLINFSGLPADTPVQVQLIGGDAGSGLNNWLGDLTVRANGTQVGVWNAADDNDTTASIATFDATTSAGGDLAIELTVDNPPQPGSNGSFAGYAAATVLAVPEPGALSLLGLGGLALLRRRRRQGLGR